jgi:C4-dicarboxylate transporter, DctQ subunit
MRLIERLIHWLCALGVAIAAVSVLLSLALIGYSVVMRYFVNDPVPWVDELVGYLLVVSVMLGAGEALRRGEHISVDIVTERLGVRGKRMAQLFSVASVALTAAILVWQGWSTVAFSRMAGVISNGYLAAPMWIPQLAVPVGAAILLLMAIAVFVAVLRGDPDAMKKSDHGAPGGTAPPLR